MNRNPPSPLAALRILAGLKQSDVATAINRNRSHVSRMEQGEFGVRPHERTLARLYGVSKEEVIRAAEGRAKN